MNLLTWASRRRFPYEPLIRIELSQKNLIHNLHEFQKLAPKSHSGHAQVALVLKSNAYGHGLIEIAKIIQNEPHIPFCVVDSYFEAIALRSKGFKIPLLIIGYTRPETILDSHLKNVAFTVTNLETLRTIVGEKKESLNSTAGIVRLFTPLYRLRPKMIHIHLKIDTGMHRQGITTDQIDEAIHLLGDNSDGRHPIKLEGICSHLSDADNADESFTESQTHLWNKIVEKFKHEFSHMKYIHLSATDGHRLTHDIAANVSRLGIGLYGLSENPAITSRISLKPVLEMKTIITGIKKLREGETIGYGNTFKAAQEMTVATIPVGYFEGFDRRLSNNGSVLVGPDRIVCPIIGRVSMNIISIDVSKVTNLKIGDEVIAISNDPIDENSIVNIAKKCETISYEIAVHIPAHLKRIVA